MNKDDKTDDTQVTTTAVRTRKQEMQGNFPQIDQRINSYKNMINLRQHKHKTNKRSQSRQKSRTKGGDELFQDTQESQNDKPSSKILGTEKDQQNHNKKQKDKSPYENCFTGMSKTSMSFYSQQSKNLSSFVSNESSSKKSKISNQEDSGQSQTSTLISHQLKTTLDSQSDSKQSSSQYQHLKDTHNARESKKTEVYNMNGKNSTKSAVTNKFYMDSLYSMKEDDQSLNINLNSLSITRNLNIHPVVNTSNAKKEANRMKQRLMREQGQIEELQKLQKHNNNNPGGIDAIVQIPTVESITYNKMKNQISQEDLDLADQQRIRQTLALNTFSENASLLTRDYTNSNFIYNNNSLFNESKHDSFYLSQEQNKLVNLDKSFDKNDRHRLEPIYSNALSYKKHKDKLNKSHMSDEKSYSFSPYKTYSNINQGSQLQ